MATKESEGLQPNGLYALGNYNFRLERSSVPGSTNDKIEAICMNGGKNARKSIQVASNTQLTGWYVEANETTADVYADINVAEHGSDQKKSALVPVAFPISNGVLAQSGDGTRSVTGGVTTAFFNTPPSFTAICASESPFTMTVVVQRDGREPKEYTHPISTSCTYNNKVFYFGEHGSSADTILPNAVGISQYSHRDIAWTMLYGEDAGEPEYKKETVLIGRFAIDIDEAGGDGPGSDWDDPGDWNEDWEEGDPTQTLHVEVIGALSGRHNDPIEDPSYSYIPADKETVKGYGCGGDGGHGGGGGAGASNIVVYKFATDKADNKEIVCKPKRHGYGSGGGKGGKGGDGCILIYY